MRKQNWLFYITLPGMLLSGCTTDKKVWEAIARIEKRLDIIEEIVLPPKAAVQEHAYLIPINKSPVLGKPDAKTNIVVFSNFECPYCSRADGLLRQIVADPELKDHVNLVFKHFPFDRHKLARPAAKAALAAGEQGKFWEMSELIFANQPNLSEENFKKWAQQIGLDLNKFNSDLKDHDKKYDEQINEDIKIGTETAKLKGTPWITIGGWLFEVEPMNAQSVKDFIKAKNL